MSSRSLLKIIVIGQPVAATPAGVASPGMSLAFRMSEAPARRRLLIEVQLFAEMSMTPAEIDMVKQSFAQVAPIADEAGALFYNRLFTLDPSLQGLFREDIAAQSRKLMQMLATAVNGLDKLETIVPAVQALGVRHVRYGVTEAHYDTVAAALLWTLEQGLGADFTPQVREAWVAAYSILAGAMKAAAREVAVG